MDALYAKTISLLNIFVKKAGYEDATNVGGFDDETNVGSAVQAIRPEQVEIPESFKVSMDISNKQFNLDNFLSIDDKDLLTIRTYLNSTMKPDDYNMQLLRQLSGNKFQEYAAYMNAYGGIDRGEFNINTLNSISDKDTELIRQYINNTSEFFDMDVLRNLTSTKAYYYIDYHLKPVFEGKDSGRGTGRIVYDLGDRVIKLAHNDAGMYQNTMESRIASRSNLFTDVYEVGPKNKWIISEKVKPMSPGEFAVRTGIPANITNITNNGNTAKIKSLKNEELDRLALRYDMEEDAKELLKQMAFLYREFGTILGDVINPEHWGLSGDGRLKLYDYGLDYSGHQKFYDSSGTVKAGPTKEEAEALSKFMDKSKQISALSRNLTTSKATFWILS